MLIFPAHCIDLCLSKSKDCFYNVIKCSDIIWMDIHIQTPPPSLIQTPSALWPALTTLPHLLAALREGLRGLDLGMADIMWL